MDDAATLIANYRQALSERGSSYLPRDEFLKQFGLTMPDILRAGFDGYTGLVAAAGGPAPSNTQLDETELLSDFCRVASKLGRPPSVDQYRAHGQHSPTNMTRRLGGSWAAVRERATEYARARGDDTALTWVRRGVQTRPVAAKDRRTAERPSVVTESSTGSRDLDAFTSGSRVGVEMMSDHYAKLYCLERQMRSIVADTLSAKYGDSWWNQCVSTDIRDYAQQALASEERLGVTPRSSRLIDYITLGHLGNIVDAKWSEFQTIFKNQQAMKRIMRDLNMLRAFVAHCTPLPTDEVMRLDLNLRDWHRQLR